MVKQVPLGVGEQKVGVGVDFLWMLHLIFQQAGLLLQGRRLLTDWGCFGEFGWGLFNGEPSCWPALCVFWTASSVAHVSFFLLIRGRYNWTICFLPSACSQLGNCARKLLVKVKHAWSLEWFQELLIITNTLGVWGIGLYIKTRSSRWI